MQDLPAIEDLLEAQDDAPVIRMVNALLMQAVTGLAQGALVLPGFDFSMPTAVWDKLDDSLTSEDHPQYRFRKIMDALGIDHAGVRNHQPSPRPLIKLNLNKGGFSVR